MNFDPQTITAEKLADPSVTQADLATVASVRPDLWAAIVAHPNVYPALKEWIAQQQGRAAVPPPSQAPGATSAPAGAPEQVAGAPGQPAGAPDGAAAPSAGDQISAGAKQIASGAKAFFNDTVAPAATNLAEKVQNSSGGVSGKPAQAPAWLYYALFGSFGVLFISLFLPIVTVGVLGESYSFNYFSAGAPVGDGVLLLLLSLAGGGLTAAAMVTKKFPLGIAAAAVGALGGLLAIIDGFGSTSRISGYPGLSIGVGAILLGLAGLAALALSVLHGILLFNGQQKNKNN